MMIFWNCPQNNKQQWRVHVALAKDYPFPNMATYLRIEIMEAIPKHIQSQCRNHGMFGTIGILVRVMRE
eukprot:12921614-Prorocentrum_lima.AAC.1